MKVIATKKGFIHSLYRNVGDCFEVEKKEFNKEWMKEFKEEKTKPVVSDEGKGKDQKPVIPDKGDVVI